MLDIRRERELTIEMACSQDLRLFVNGKHKRSDSMITNFDEAEWDNVPVNHISKPESSVMLMNSYFDFICKSIT